VATVMQGGPKKGTQVLTQDDVRALFELISLVLYDPQREVDIAFSGAALAAGLDEYREHLMKLMNNWDGLSRALHGRDARRRARALNEQLEKASSNRPLVNIRGNALPTVSHNEAGYARSLIRGKGMEI
jgi:hypothetical protein